MQTLYIPQETTAVELVVTDHAVQRYRERTNCKQALDNSIREIIRQRISQGTEVVHKTPQQAALSIIKHGFTKATYIRHNGIVFVITDNNVVTLHKGEANRWKAMQK